MQESASQKVAFQFITCKITGDEGIVWVAYTRSVYDENGEKITVGANILSLWRIEKHENEWQVIRIEEAP